MSDYVAATSVGIVAGMPLLDLAYEEDSKADVDMNIVKTSDGRFIEIQGTAEAEPFSDRRADRTARARRQGHHRPDRQAARDRRIDPRPLMQALLIATTNPNKLREIRPLLAGVPCELVTLADVAPIPEPDETGATFWENARIKALAYAAGVGTDYRRRRFRSRKSTP